MVSTAEAPRSDAVQVEEQLPTRYCIFNREHGRWHKPNWAGYTDDVREAGLYRHDEAASMVLDVIPSGKNVAVPSNRAQQFGVETIWGGARVPR